MILYLREVDSMKLWLFFLQLKALDDDINALFDNDFEEDEMFTGLIPTKDPPPYPGTPGTIELIDSYHVKSKCMLGKRKHVYKVHIYNECVIIRLFYHSILQNLRWI